MYTPPPVSTGYPLLSTAEPLVITHPSEDSRIEFIRTVVALKLQEKISDEQAVKKAKQLFAEAGIVMPGKLATRLATEAAYVKTGAPARGTWVLLRKEWDNNAYGRRSGDWVDTPTWEKAARCYGRVTSRKTFQGRPGEGGLCFNVRCVLEPGHHQLTYSPTRLYLVDEGVTWKPVNPPH